MTMYLALDVQYGDDSVGAACVAFLDPKSDAIAFEFESVSPGSAEPYEPGHFYRRELRYLTTLVERAQERAPKLRALFVDGYVWLGQSRPGLGHALHEATRGLPVIGVAKSAFRDAPAVLVHRGQSERPLFVTAIGLHSEEAADIVRSMHGPHRIPTLLKRADRLARDSMAPADK